MESRNGKGNKNLNPDRSLYNSDLAPTPKNKRNWGWWSYTALWMGIVTNIVAWEVAANLIRIGMSFWQAFGCISLSYGLVFIVILLNGHSGAKYGIPFPVIARSSFGYNGAQVTVVMRTILSIFWFGVMMYIGSKAVDGILSVSFTWWADLEDIRIIGMGLNMFIAYLLTWLLHAYLALHGVERIRRFELWAGPVILLLGISLVVWAINVANGIQPLVSLTSTIPKNEFVGSFFLSMTALIGTMSALMLNIPDLTRFSKSQRDQTIGQAIGLPTMFILFSLMGILVTAGTIHEFGIPITDPIELLKQFDNPFVAIIGALAVLTATTSTSVATNLVSAGFDLTNLFPSKLNYRKSGMIAIVIAVVAVPWLWFDDAELINVIMGGIAAALGPAIGIMIVDYHIIRKRYLNVEDLYVKFGQYAYKKGWNIHALIAMVMGIIIAIIGLFVPYLENLYTFNWFLGVGFGGAIYLLLMWKNRYKSNKEIEGEPSKEIL